MDFFSTILTDFYEYPKGALFGAIFRILTCLLIIYFIKPKKYKWKRLNILSLSMLLLWLFWGPFSQENGFARKVNFNDLLKITQELKYENNTGFFFEDSNRRKNIFFVELCGKESDIKPYVGKVITIYEYKHFIYQLESDNKVVFDLNRSNSKVWLALLMDILLYYIMPFFDILMLYMMILRANKRE